MKLTFSGKELVDTALGKKSQIPLGQAISVVDPTSTDNAEFKCSLQLLEDSIPADKTKYTRMEKACHGVSEETTTGVHRLREMAAKGELCSQLSTSTIA